MNRADLHDAWKAQQELARTLEVVYALVDVTRLALKSGEYGETDSAENALFIALHTLYPLQEAAEEKAKELKQAMEGAQ